MSFWQHLTFNGYKILVPNRTGKLEKFIIASPTCDSADVLYEKIPYALPCDV